MKIPKVVVGLPVYNGERYLAAAIESHLGQSFGDFQLVISDNGSTDATADICSEYARKDGRVTHVRSDTNQGLLWNHRRVLDAISAPEQYFRWAGADDILEPGLLQEMVTTLDTRPDVEAVVPNTKNIDADGRMIGAMDRVLDLQSDDVLDRARDILVADYQHVIAYGLLRASTLRSMRTQPNYPGWDPIFAWELVLRGKMAQTVEFALFRRLHAGSISRVKTVGEMRTWVEPTAKTGLGFPNWMWSYERMRTFMSSPLSPRNRLRVGVLVARSTLWDRKALFRDVVHAAKRTLGLSDRYDF